MNQNYKKLVVMNRIDGTGARLVSMINTMALATKLSSIDNMRFRWDETIFADKGEQVDDCNTKMRSFNNQTIIGASCERKENIFTDNFIKKHYLEKYETDNQIRPVGDINQLKELYDKSDYLKVELDFFVSLYSNEFEYRSQLALMWDKIEFKDNILHMIDLAKQHCEKLNHFIAIHLRSGDVIYTYAPNRLNNRIFLAHATPYEFALGIIEKHKDQNIVIIGDDVTSMRELKNMANNSNVKLIEEFRDIDKYSNLELFIYDVVFMSRAQLLYGTHSSLVRLAWGINSNLQNIHPHYMIDPQTLYLWLKTYYNTCKNLSPSQRAYSCFCLFDYGEKCNEKLEILQKYLQDALEFDPENDKYRIHIINCLLKKDKAYQANELLKDYLTNRFEQFCYVFTMFNWSDQPLSFKEVFANYIKYANEQYPYLSFMAAKASEALGQNSNAIKYYKYAKKELANQANACLLNLFEIEIQNLENNIKNTNEILNTKTQELQTSQDIINSLNNQINTLTNQLNTLTTEINSYPIKKQSLEISNLEQDLINKKLKAQILEKELGLDNEINLKYNNALQENENLKAQLSKLNQEFETNNPKSKSENQKLQKINTDLYFALNYGTAKSRIKNQLTYKLGEAMIANSKSLLGYIKMPYILSYIKETHQKNQKLYQEKIKANPSLKLPPLETYPDYNEAIKIKEHLSYKLGEALIDADKSKLKLGYLTLWFKCKNITKEHKDNHKNSPNNPNH